MEFGAHLPLMAFDGRPPELDGLVAYAETASQLGFSALAVNDHLVFSVPWLDGLVALTAVIEHSGSMTLATTVSLPVVRGPVAVAKSLAAIDRLSGGRLLVAVGPGSSAQDYAAVGIEFSERWERFEEAVQVLRAVWQADAEPFVGRFYSTEGLALEPLPAQPGGPPIWIGSWGSEVGMRRVARLADGWLASAYNTTPARFGDARHALEASLDDREDTAAPFPNALATMWCYITDDRRDAERILRERVAPVVRRSEDVLRERLAIGPPESVAVKLRAFTAAGLQRVFIWPVGDEIEQLELFWSRVRPLVQAA